MFDVGCLNMHITNPRWRTLNHHNSATVQRIAMKFGTVAHYNPLNPTREQNVDFLKSKMVDCRHLEKKRPRAGSGP